MIRADIRCPGDHKPADHRAGNPERHIYPKYPAPPEAGEQNAADHGTQAEADSLSRGVDPQASLLPIRTGDLDQNGNAVGRHHRTREAQQHAQADQQGQVRCQAAHRGGKREQREAEQIHQLATGHFGEPGEYRQGRDNAQRVGKSDPTHLAQSRREMILERWQCELDDAGVELAHEPADRVRRDDQPWIVRAAGNEFGRRRLVTAEKAGTQPHCP